MTSTLEDTFACEDWADLRGEAKNINGEFIGKEVQE